MSFEQIQCYNAATSFPHIIFLEKWVKLREEKKNNKNTS